MATGDHNWMYGKNVIVWGHGYWRSDIASWLVNRFQCNLVNQVTNTGQIPDGEWLILMRVEDHHMQRKLEAYGVLHGHKWIFRSSGEINALAQALALGSIPVIPTQAPRGPLSDDPDCGMF